MDVLLGIGGLVVGLVVGYVAASASKKGAPGAGDAGEDTDWWELRKSLTGTQLQILQFMEGRREASIDTLQERFSFIPDRELYYRLEQIVLMGFLHRGRKDEDVVYKLNPSYSGRVEDDKTVMLSSD